LFSPFASVFSGFQCIIHIALYLANTMTYVSVFKPWIIFTKNRVYVQLYGTGQLNHKIIQLINYIV